MKLAILSCSPKCYSTTRLREAAEARGHKVKVLNTLKFAIDVAQGDPDLYYRSKPLSHYDAVLPRIGASITYFGTAVVRQFEQMDVFVANSSNGISNSRDKLRSLQILSKHHVGIPETTFVRDRTDVLPAIERVGGAPVIIKLLEGTQGVGVILADNTKVAEAIIETLQSARQNVLVQKFVKESKGRDVRAFVVGDRVVGAMRRIAQGTEFRSNVHRGGRVEPVTLDEQYAETAVRAAQIMGMKVAGVDLLEGNDGPQIMEVNSSPGLQGIEMATGLDIAGAVVDYIAAQVSFPELDVRQRLTVSRGYGVAELRIPEGSDYVGRTIVDSGLRERDINVLTLARDTTIIPNPNSSRVLEPGDRLLCFGKLESMRDLVPPKIRKARRPKVKNLPPEDRDSDSQN
ncbi:RimK family alpha-L-glutamate ligase [bacterium]|uniref:SSU ribosomal protein S6P modification protein n=1 Tax=Rubinisphaera brasiliensis (strain ATCC 49424 / DSM 5305 / JCM 21570 / IAM 15109 / NBRC 103401 / IFAM 1448) TaxID=756272 RepID=F0SRS7_RUBBR|nr:RimK family alpha-L-glutamate ligase [Rubinisphaera brasiliensis]ADY60243.1 SSU ribosomal protein S6P modification protein [Rubinisphaera brasiliensis DSM 5305]MBB03061.1 RimK family alpha-L-glutamate ligase [Planctomyces sp.]MBR9804777.1 RimK family alpha-L-glutamate ligase [bacterium]